MQLNSKDPSPSATRPASGDLRWLVQQIRPYLGWHLASVALVLAGSLLSLIDPLVMRWFIDTALPARSMASIAVGVALIFLSYQGRVILNSCGGYLSFRANQQFILNLRLKLIRHSAGLSATYHDATPLGAKSYVLCDNTQELGTLGSDLFPMLLRTAVMAVCIVGVMFWLNLRLTLSVLPLIPIFLVTIRACRRRLQNVSDRVQGRAAHATSILQEVLGSMIQIQLLSREHYHVRKVFQAWTGTVRAEFARKKAEITYVIACSSIIVIGIAMVLSYGGRLVLTRSLSVGGLVAFYAYLTRMFEPLYGAIELNSRFQRVAASARRIRQFLGLQPSVVESTAAADLPDGPAKGEIRVQGARYHYRAGSSTIRNINLRIAPGERVAIVGPSGAGKSTLAMLLARLYDPESGTILIDGFDLRDLRLKSIRSQVCYLPQQAVLFDCNLRENLRLGNLQASFEEILKAARIVELEHWLERIPEGLELGPSGNYLSGGERQRVAIARAVLQSPRILILDEATSALDRLAEQRILRRIDHSLPETTLVLISHRLPAISWVQRLLVMNNGTLVDSGAHSDLYSRSSLYAHLFDKDATDDSIASPADSWVNADQSSAPILD